MSRSVSSGLFTLLFGTFLGLLPAGGMVAATTEERLMTDPPAAWWYYTGATIADLSSVIANNNARIIDLKLRSAGGTPTFNAVLVSNTGAWAKGWWWYYGVNGTDLDNLLAANNARLISLAPYDVGGTVYFAAVMVSNTGSEAKAWWWDYGRTTTELLNLAISRNARIVDFRSYVSGGTRYYCAVMIANSGEDARSWWFWANATPADLTSAYTADHARIYGLSSNTPSAGTFDAIVVGCPCPSWWWYTGASVADLEAARIAHNARVVSFESYDPGTGTVFAALMLTMTPGISSFYPVTPCRLLDTRNSTGADAAAPSLSALEVRTFDATTLARCGIPWDAAALVANTTAVLPAAAGELSLYPSGIAWPGTSSLSFDAGQVRGNSTLLPLDGLGSFVVRNGSPGPVDVVVDVNGYFQ